MSYYTDYSLAVQGILPDDIDSLMTALREHNCYGLDYDSPSYEEDRKMLFVYGTEAVKWYSARRDIYEVAQGFPNASFRLNGMGEERDDIWDYYVNASSDKEETIYWHALPPKNVPWDISVDPYLFMFNS